MIKAAFCPLKFNAIPLREHPHYRELPNDHGLGQLDVGLDLHYPRSFTYIDQHGNQRSGTQIVTAPFGLAPKDFDLFLGLYTLLKRLPEEPSDGRLFLTADVIGKSCNLPTTCQKDYRRIRSLVFRFSYAKYTNSAFWNPESRTYNIVNFGFFNIDSLSQMVESRRPIVFQFDPSFLRIAQQSKFLSFDYELYCSMSPALRRFYLIANRDGWNQRNSSVFIADRFAVNQIGFDDSPQRKKLRMQRLRKILSEAEDMDLIRPPTSWGSYFRPVTRGRFNGQLGLRWSRGPALRTRDRKQNRRSETSLDDDPLFAQIKELRDEAGEPPSPAVFHHWCGAHGRELLQKHLLIILAQKEQAPDSFQKSEVAALIDRVRNDYTEPDWYRDLRQQERLATFKESTPNQLSKEMYQSFFS